MNTTRTGNHTTEQAIKQVLAGFLQDGVSVKVHIHLEGDGALTRVSHEGALSLDPFESIGELVALAGIYDEHRPLRVWWIPQIPLRDGVKPFFFPVFNLVQAGLLLDALAQYDLYQLATNIKPDFANAGGLQVQTERDGWEDWYTNDGDSFEFWWDDVRPAVLLQFDNGHFVEA